MTCVRTETFGVCIKQLFAAVAGELITYQTLVPSD